MNNILNYISDINKYCNITLQNIEKLEQSVKNHKDCYQFARDEVSKDNYDLMLFLLNYHDSKKLEISDCKDIYNYAERVWFFVAVEIYFKIKETL